MAEKRRDSKNRVLKTGESQRKDGRYMYKYTDVDGKAKYEYSWRLVPTDKMPAGKKEEPCLRDKIKEVEDRLRKGVSHKAASLSVVETVEASFGMRKLRPTTLLNYRCIVENHLKPHDIANAKIGDVKKSDVRKFVMELDSKGLSCGSIKKIVGMIGAAFEIAVMDDLITSNPFRIQVSKIVDSKPMKVKALTKPQQESFMNAVMKNSRTKKYYDEVVILFETGLRIGEFIGLTMKDVDMVNRRIYVRHQLSDSGELVPPKSEAGIREIPMTDACYESMSRLLRRGRKRLYDLSDDRPHFVMTSNKGKPVPRETWGNRFRAIQKFWESIDPDNATRVTPHVCRHTFCTNLARAGVGVKAAQYLMGHSTPQMTIGVYTDADYMDAENEIVKLNKAM